MNLTLKLKQIKNVSWLTLKPLRKHEEPLDTKTPGGFLSYGARVHPGNLAQNFFIFDKTPLSMQ